MSAELPLHVYLVMYPHPLITNGVLMTQYMAGYSEDEIREACLQMGMTGELIVDIVDRGPA